MLWILLVVGAFVAYQLLSNRKTRQADPATKEAALAFRPAEGKSTIYVLREGFIGKAVGMDIRIDNQLVAQIKSPRFTCIEVSPGKHVVAVAIVGLQFGDKHKATAEVTIAPGDVVGLRYSVKMGLLENTTGIETITDKEALRSKLQRMTMTMAEVPVLGPGMESRIAG